MASTVEGSRGLSLHLQDLLGGLLLAWALMLVLVPVALPVDHLLLNSPWGPPLVVGVVALLCLAYPAPREWTPARGDSCVVLATVAGILAGEGALFQTGWRTPLLHAQVGHYPYLGHGAWSVSPTGVFIASEKVAPLFLPDNVPKVSRRCSCAGRCAAPLKMKVF